MTKSLIYFIGGLATIFILGLGIGYLALRRKPPSPPFIPAPTPLVRSTEGLEIAQASSGQIIPITLYRGIISDLPPSPDGQLLVTLTLQDQSLTLDIYGYQLLVPAYIPNQPVQVVMGSASSLQVGDYIEINTLLKHVTIHYDRN